MPSLGESPLPAGTELHRVTQPKHGVQVLNEYPPKRVRDGLRRYGLVAYDEAKRFAHMNVALDAHRYSKGCVSFETVPPHCEHAFSPTPALHMLFSLR